MKSFLAVLAGLVFTVLVSTGLDAVMHSTGVFPESALDKVPEMTTGQWLIAASYRLVAAIGGGWITARLAPSRPMFLALVLGGVGTVLALLGFIGALVASPKLGPLWYPALLVVTAVPCTWLGGKLGLKDSTPAAAAVS
jgi:hypothetical protein